jgi:hypothetical protein
LPILPRRGCQTTWIGSLHRLAGLGGPQPRRPPARLVESRDAAPVVDGGSCPWNLDCHNCDKFVLSGADLLYWRRKREQWRQLAEDAPDEVTAEYLHRYFEPTARAIDGLEQALAGLGLLDHALALDLRKPHDYFHRVWSTAFRATDLADTFSADNDNTQNNDEQETCA